MKREALVPLREYSPTEIWNNDMMFGQIVIGAPGAGKTTYCDGMSQILSQLGRPVVCVNLDPANDYLPYKCDIDIRELVRMEDITSRLDLGPNGALRYCMQTLKKNMEWLRLKLSRVDGYFLFDFPGQLELYSSDNCISSIIHNMEKWGFRLVAVHLSDSLYCTNAGKFISVLLCALSIMINLECAQINVLSKQDLLEDNDLPYNFEFFEQIPEMSRLIELLDESPVLKQYKGLNEMLCSVIDDYDLIKFTALDVTNKKHMLNLLKLADTANGYAFTEAPDLRNIVQR
ncbi:GPN-loop GTPase 2 [Dirofilaria immitis]|nr:GPN-loop GTPase 2 [Dirofilaria immitis]